MNRFDALEQRYETLQPRERLLLALAAVALLVLGLFVLWIEPRLDAHKAAQAEIASLQPQVEGLRVAVGRLESELARDPELPRREALERLRAEAAALDATFVEDGRQAISPARMPGLLRELLGRDARLRVAAVQVLPPEILRWAAAPVAPAAAGSTAAAPAAAAASVMLEEPAAPALPILYRHRVELRFEGSYAATLDYVRTLEALPYRLRLHRLDIDATRWPLLKVTVKVETLGLEEGWIGV